MKKKEILINLNEFVKIQKFINKVTSFESDIDVVSGKYVVNAKSIMAIFSLDLSTPIGVLIDTENKEEIRRFNEVMKEFM